MFSENKHNMKTVIALVSAVILTVSFVSAGCKEKPSETSKPVETQIQEEQQQAAEVAQEATKAAEQSVMPTEPKANLDDIIAGARGWGAVYKSWQGKAAPDFTAIDLDGKKHSLSDYKGKKVLLVFWATWCPPCIVEIPDLKELRTSLSEQEVAILAIGGKDEGMEKIKPFAKSKEMNYTVLVEEDELPAPFGVTRIYRTTGIPGAFFIDSEGIIKLGTVGIVPLKDSKAILNAI